MLRLIIGILLTYVTIGLITICVSEMKEKIIYPFIFKQLLKMYKEISSQDETTDVELMILDKLQARIHIIEKELYNENNNVYECKDYVALVLLWPAYILGVICGYIESIKHM